MVRHNLFQVKCIVIIINCHASILLPSRFHCSDKMIAGIVVCILVKISPQTKRIVYIYLYSVLIIAACCYSTPIVLVFI